MKKLILLAAAAGVTAMVQAQSFLPKHLAVLRAGDGEIKLHLKQSPAFVDEFTPGVLNGAPVMTVAIPTNGASAFFFNGHASTEGMMALSADGQLLCFAGYGGLNLLAQDGTPSRLNIGRAFCTVDAAGKTHTIVYEQYGGSTKMNPRGAVTDGHNHFWSCGNSSGTAFYDAGSDTLVPFTAVPDSREVKIVNGTLYTTLDGPDAIFLSVEPGIFSFQDDGEAAPLPQTKNTTLKLEVPANKAYTKIEGFDINPQGTIAYTADEDEGIQKYVKANGQWQFAYNFAIPQNIPAADNHANGCFAVTVDFSGANPVIYATTTEGYDGCVNSNRVVQIVDTGASSAVTTLAQARSANIAYRGIAFTPGTTAK